MRKTLLLLALSVGVCYTYGQPVLQTPTKRAARQAAALEKTIQAALLGFRGDVGVFVYHIPSGQTVAIRADSLFPTASTIKIPIQCGIFDKIAQGAYTYNQPLLYRDSLKYDDGIVGSLKDSTRIELSQVIMLMETISDNTGSLWCQKLAGGGEAINQWLDQNGFRQTRVNSRTPGRSAFQQRYGWGQTTPRELAGLLMYIRQGNAISPAASDEMYRNLGRQYYDHDGLSEVPPSVKVATKNGAVNQARSEVAYVHAPHGEYVYCVMTKNQQDQQWSRNNDGNALLRRIGAILWRHFEPKSDWKPAEGYEKWW